MSAQIYDFISERVKRVKQAVIFHKPEMLKLDVEKFESLFENIESADIFKEYGEHFK